MMYIDLHTHILPNVDDGSKSIEESLEMLKMLKKQGVGAVVLSPHFYPYSETSIEGYKARTVSSYEKLCKAAKDIFPELYLGSEVYYFRGIALFENIKSLCIHNSKYILIELPYGAISQKTVNDIIELNLNCGLTPILAHIERYRHFKGFEHILSLISDGYALGQMNAYTPLHFKTRRIARKLIKGGYISFIASDSHSQNNNPPRIGESLSYIERKIGQGFAAQLRQNSFDILNEIRGYHEENSEHI